MRQPSGMSFKTCYAAMFHYVRPSYEGTGIRGLTVSEFRDLLNGIRLRFEFINPSNLFRVTRKSIEYKETHPSVLLTFDDGLRDHYEFVAPILEEYDIRGLFFVNSQQYQLGCSLLIHRWHAIRERIPHLVDNQVFKKLVESLDTKNFDIRSAIRWDDGAMANFKYCFNYRMSEKEQTFVVTTLESEFGLNPPAVEKIYMTPTEISDLVRRGHLVASHSHAHSCLARLTESELRHDLNQSFDFITSVGGDRRVFAYPFGKSESFSTEVMDVISSVGVQVAFSSVPPSTTQGTSPLSIPRLDPRDLAMELDLQVLR